MQQVLVPFTEGVEEIEVVSIVDILRRANIHVCMASLDGKQVIGRSGITIQADESLVTSASKDWDMIVLPGGLPNAKLLKESPLVKKLILGHALKNKHIAAICAAPTALASFGLTKGLKVTSHPSVQLEMTQAQPSSTYIEKNIVEDGLIITSRGAGTAIDFALFLAAKLTNQQKADAIRTAILA